MVPKVKRTKERLQPATLPNYVPTEPLKTLGSESSGNWCILLVLIAETRLRQAVMLPRNGQVCLPRKTWLVEHP